MFQELSPSVLEQVAPTPGGPLPHSIMTYSGSGDVTAPVSTPTGDVRGCATADFAGFPAGDIALVSRGTPTGSPVPCTFAIKALNALAAGASGVIIYNNTGGPLNGTLGADFLPDRPVVGIEQSLGQHLASTTGLVVHLKTDTRRPIATTANVLAELRGKNADNVVMAGAHLGSVPGGRASTTTAVGPRPFSRSPRTSERSSRRTRFGSPGGRPRSRVSSVRRTTSPTCPRPSCRRSPCT